MFLSCESLQAKLNTSMHSVDEGEVYEQIYVIQPSASPEKPFSPRTKRSKSSSDFSAKSLASGTENELELDKYAQGDIQMLDGETVSVICEPTNTSYEKKGNFTSVSD